MLYSKTDKVFNWISVFGRRIRERPSKKTAPKGKGGNSQAKRPGLDETLESASTEGGEGKSRTSEKHSVKSFR